MADRNALAHAQYDYVELTRDVQRPGSEEEASLNGEGREEKSAEFGRPYAPPGAV